MQNKLQASTVKLSYNPILKHSERVSISSSDDVYKLLKEGFYQPETIEHKEFFIIVLLNKAGKVLGVYQLSEGGSDQTVVDVKIIMQAAILSNSSSIILSHNHPSGNLLPSSNDIEMTKKIKQAGELMRITLLDHVILNKESYYSFADEGII